MGQGCFLSSIFGGGASQQAYNPITAQNINPHTDSGQLVGNQNQLYNQQQQFAQALQQQAAGQGPSVAGQQLQQALQQQQAGNFAQAASSRGEAPALANRNAMQANAQQSQASAQSAALAKAQEAMNAQAQLGNVYGNMSNQQAGQQQLDLSAQNANQQAQLGAQEATSKIGQAQNQAQAGTVGGIAQGIMSMAPMLAAHGGVVHYDGGGIVDPTTAASPYTNLIQSGLTPAAANAVIDNQTPAQGLKNGPQSPLGKMLAGLKSGQQQASKSDNPFFSSMMGIGQGIGAAIGGMKSASQNSPSPSSAPSDTPTMQQPPTPGQDLAVMSKGGKVPAMVSPGEIRVPANKAKNPKEAERYAAYAAKSGKKIPGKPRVDSDSLQNDTIPRNLNEGDIIVPRSKSKKPDDAAAFVRALLASQRKGQS
jgi:hypothetical protein